MDRYSNTYPSGFSWNICVSGIISTKRYSTSAHRHGLQDLLSSMMRRSRLTEAVGEWGLCPRQRWGRAVARQEFSLSCLRDSWRFRALEVSRWHDRLRLDVGEITVTAVGSRWDWRQAVLWSWGWLSIRVGLALGTQEGAAVIWGLVSCSHLPE